MFMNPPPSYPMMPTGSGMSYPSGSMMPMPPNGGTLIPPYASMPNSMPMPPYRAMPSAIPSGPYGTLGSVFHSLASPYPHAYGYSPTLYMPTMPGVPPVTVPSEAPKPFKDGGSMVQFTAFHGSKDRRKALQFLQQFDTIFQSGNYTESSKLTRVAGFLKDNALQWWASQQNQPFTPSTWADFKRFFCHVWLTPAYEAELLAQWNTLGMKTGENLETYNQRFWDVFLPVSFFKPIPLSDQLEKYCCGLPLLS